jgi:hypothetical protein
MSWLPKTSVVVPHDFSEQSDEADPEGNTFFDYTKQNPVPGAKPDLPSFPYTIIICRQSTRRTGASRLRFASIWISRDSFVRRRGARRHDSGTLE